MSLSPVCPARFQRIIQPVESLPDLLRGARDGDQPARAELVRRFYPRVQVLVHAQVERRLRRGGHGALARMSTGDIVQEVFVEVLRGLDRWDGADEQAFVGLLATLVEHRLVDLVRRHQAARRDVRRQGEAGPEEAGAGDDRTPSMAVAAREQVEIYRAVLCSFADRERALLTLRLEEGLEFQELARRLAYPSADAARKAFHVQEARLLLRLRARGIGPPGETCP
ncbi:MAG: sigma-70 family RNA polymerase sigma factor [Planctomycetes bacterium]|nr:sigma-70 family RNA polymerase sigma factor [Planctomycetota bacterium]